MEQTVFSGFATHRVALSVGQVPCRVGGEGPPVLLLHGYPETHVMWHAVAGGLAERFTVVAPDLRGYGDSPKPVPDHTGAPYAFRDMAADQAALMTALGFDRFAVAGHDRGARVTHRLLLDHPERVSRAVLIDIAPTLFMYETADAAFARAYWHWFFLIQPDGLPERLIAADPERFLTTCLRRWSRTTDTDFDRAFPPSVRDEYLRAFRDPDTIRATTADYRAAVGIDLDHDRQDRAAGRRIRCPLLVLWGDKGLVGQRYDLPAVWRDHSVASVDGLGLPCGHFVPEERPAETLAALLEFFATA